MDLLLWRHAEAEDGYPDLLRKLTPRGEQQAQWMADWIKKNVSPNLRIVVSPATRCQQTASALGLHVEIDPRLGTNAGVAELLAAVRCDDEARGVARTDQRAVLAVGHQPTLGQAAMRLLAGRNEQRELPKGALWWLSLPPDTPAVSFAFITPGIR